ncbi:hypothetical protein PPACK8108_LOCUS874 [Phakopsora pachyrhizi]|uniref:Uncharacterized protein n=1 Tax=Phakopsora pachyrhizi TaxID=170000 RepID=A0AAV0AGY2_PHAPC|nr:hypothetical protein PPACK8108_LOCUS874 [Phakopsora pachyrhizi]
MPQGAYRRVSSQGYRHAQDSRDSAPKQNPQGIYGPPAPIGAGWVLMINRNGHIEDFALEVLNGLINMPQGAYRRVGP